MNISYHPLYRKEAVLLKNFLKKEGISLNVNYVIGGDGSLFTYASFNQPNLLISPENSVGYYSACRISNFKSFIKEYARDPLKHNKEFMTVEVLINNKVLPERAINEVLITEGIDKVFKSEINEVREYNSGVLVYTPHGWKGYAKNFGANYFNDLSIASIAPFKGKLTMKGSPINNLELKILENHEPKLFIDCKDVSPYNKTCTDRKKVFIKPYHLHASDKIIIRKGEPVIIVKN